MAEHSGSSCVFTRGFLPGLVLGVVVGAVVCLFVTEVVGTRPKFDAKPGAASGVVDDQRDRESGAPSREELERQAQEAQQKAQDAAGDQPETPKPAEEPKEGDG
ncbi:MAG: hypothetical protein H6810_10830 [Phycisphaeraceae bacterium]|nr:MAG: hypothetical protein H6810_10830 [Phycisphaeraceae bacterium]